MIPEKSEKMSFRESIFATIVGILVIIQITSTYYLYNFQNDFLIHSLGWFLLFPGFILVVTSAKYDIQVTSDSLQSTGIYNYIRQPAFVGWPIVSIGISMILQLWLSSICTFAIIIMTILSIKAEEEFRVRSYGMAYDDYKKRVPLVNIFLGYWRDKRRKEAH